MENTLMGARYAFPAKPYLWRAWDVGFIRSYFDKHCRYRHVRHTPIFHATAAHDEHRGFFRKARLVQAPHAMHFPFHANIPLQPLLSSLCIRRFSLLSPYLLTTLWWRRSIDIFTLFSFRRRRYLFLYLLASRPPLKSRQPPLYGTTGRTFPI